jgi:signal transduction histidine kinase
MEGFDNDWIYAGKRRYVSYTNLDPGYYTFFVKGTNSDGVWVKNPQAIEIYISPPFWQTLWFRVLAILIIGIIIYVVFKYRITKLLEIERLRVRIASDLHDDIGSALTRISVHSEIIQNSENKKTVNSSSKKIGTMSREIITTMGDIVWSIDARNDLTKNLIDRMRDFSTGLLVEKDIQLKFSHRGLELDRKLPIHIRQNLFLIFKEAINNIYKHSNASKVTVDLTNTKIKFSMKICDNGKGYNPGLIKKGNGLKNMNLRAVRIGAQIEMSTTNGVAIILKMKNI